MAPPSSSSPATAATQHQQNLFDSRVAADGEEAASLSTARPGQAKRKLGTAIDVLEPGVGELTADFAATPAGQWLAEHAHEYGFVISYPDGATAVTCYEFEPWHLRYVPDARTPPRSSTRASPCGNGCSTAPCRRLVRLASARDPPLHAPGRRARHPHRPPAPHRLRQRGRRDGLRLGCGRFRRPVARPGRRHRHAGRWGRVGSIDWVACGLARTAPSWRSPSTTPTRRATR